MPISKLIKGGLAVAAMAAVLSLPSNAVRAGIENQDTGEQCWGQDCSDMDGVSQPSTGGGGYATLPNVSIYDCNDGETEKIDGSVRWLKANMTLVDAQMGRNRLMDWPGNSRENFVEKLDKDLKFYCINDKNKCENKGGLLGIVYPGVAQKRINICAQNIRDVADIFGVDRQSLYASTVAHEIGHLVRPNTHRKICEDSFLRPRFSQALGLAVESAHRGVDYNSDFWQSASCGTTSGVATNDRPTGMEIIDIKNQQKPPVQ